MFEIEKIIEGKEKILWQDKPKYSAYIARAFLIGFIIALIISLYILFGKQNKLWLIAPVGILISTLIISQLNYKVTHYALTNKRAIVQYGIIGRDFKSIEYDRIQNASVKIGPIGLLFKVGSISIFTGEFETVNTKGGAQTKSKYDTFDYVSNPYKVLKILQTNLSYRKESLYSGKAS